ncbi:MAG TPA: DNA-deoxyinosine glycosylase [Candidatus Cloacimonadota bacterium]|nr:DNA-deoxyinosine glycosylase [Candidatus Cloacimonadota bacterium]
MKKTGFSPVIDKNTEILILGSLPSDISIRTGEYYANPQNQFWRIIFTIFNNSIPLYQYIEKTNLLLKYKIGLWDVLTEAHRQGSLDSNIHGEVLNDFSGLFEAYPNIRKMAFNGDKAFQLYLRKKSGLPQKDLVLVTSSSSANTSKTLLQKVKEWEIALKP